MPQYYGVSSDEIWQREQETRSGMGSDEAIKRADLIDHLIANGNTDLAYDVAKGAYSSSVGASPGPGNLSETYSNTVDQRNSSGGYGAPQGGAPQVSAPPYVSSGMAGQPAQSQPAGGAYVPGGLADIVSRGTNIVGPGPGDQSGADVYAAARSRNNIDAIDPNYGKMGNAMGDQGGMEQSLYRPAARAKAANAAPAAAPYSKMANAQGDAGGYGGQLTPYQEALMRRGRPVTIPYAQGQGATQTPSVPTPLVKQPGYTAPGVQVTYNGPQPQQPQGFTQGPRGPQSSNFTPTQLPGGPQSMQGQQQMAKPQAVVIIQQDGSKLIYDTASGQWRAER